MQRNTENNETEVPTPYNVIEGDWCLQEVNKTNGRHWLIHELVEKQWVQRNIGYTDADAARWMNDMDYLNEDGEQSPSHHSKVLTYWRKSKPID